MRRLVQLFVQRRCGLFFFSAFVVFTYFSYVSRDTCCYLTKDYIRHTCRLREKRYFVVTVSFVRLKVSRTSLHITSGRFIIRVSYYYNVSLFLIKIQLSSGESIMNIIHIASQIRDLLRIDLSTECHLCISARQTKNTTYAYIFARYRSKRLGVDYKIQIYTFSFLSHSTYTFDVPHIFSHPYV